ncbi:unnamed protein product [Ambrosiozyma monospora]|uniref:Unnamed protein product n=1 Tax=Ambrosiozyma monospora TaxID=43982 RepID=A0A9W6Z2J0_AMBMO|nr:unnamed protein product [Ambrosiozyma monospora]
MNPTNMKSTTSKSTKSSGKSPVASHTRKKLAKAKVDETTETVEAVETGSSKDAGKKDETSDDDGDASDEIEEEEVNKEIAKLKLHDEETYLSDHTPPATEAPKSPMNKPLNDFTPDEIAFLEASDDEDDMPFDAEALTPTPPKKSAKTKDAAVAAGSKTDKSKKTKKPVAVIGRIVKRQSAPIVVENESDGDDEDEEMEDAPSDNASRGRTQAAANVASNHANQVETTPSTVANAQLPAAVAQTVSAQENVFKLMNFYMANQNLET